MLPFEAQRLNIDTVMEYYANISERLQLDARIVHIPHFESEILTFQQEPGEQLSIEEKRAI